MSWILSFLLSNDRSGSLQYSHGAKYLIMVEQEAVVNSVPWFYLSWMAWNIE